MMNSITAKFGISTTIIFLLAFGCTDKLFAQPIPVGDVREEQIHIQQLLNDSLYLSLSNRPVWTSSYNNCLPLNQGGIWWNNRYPYPRYSLLGDNIFAGIYDPLVQTTYNSKIPYGENNAAAWDGRGLNTQLRAGFFVTSDYLTITFYPQISYSQNQNFLVPRFVPRDDEGNVLYGDESIGFNIDRPFRFGPDSFTNFDLGNSSLRLHYKSIEAGLSKEPLWWGPGIRYALILSNNAPGLKHVLLGTRYPLQIPYNIGQLEFKIIGAWPEDSNYYEYTKETDHQRFMNGFNIIYSPSFIPGLHVGMSRISHMYIPNDGLSFSDFFRASPFSKPQGRDSDSQNQLSSAYLRWVFPSAAIEIYGEYFREDTSLDLRDLFLAPDHDRAYTIGLQKILKSNWIDFFKINLEINSLVPNRTDQVRHQTYYYSHDTIKQGHTNGGQILGAAIGPGSESEFLGVDGYFSKGRVGFFMQRIANNRFFEYEYYEQYDLPVGVGDENAFNHSVDLNIGAAASYKAGPLFLSSKLIWTKAFNYGRFNLGENQQNNGSNDLLNLNFSLAAQVLF